MRSQELYPIWSNFEVRVEDVIGMDVVRFEDVIGMDVLEGITAWVELIAPRRVDTLAPSDG